MCSNISHLLELLLRSVSSSRHCPISLLFFIAKLEKDGHAFCLSLWPPPIRVFPHTLLISVFEGHWWSPHANPITRFHSSPFLSSYSRLMQLVNLAALKHFIHSSSFVPFPGFLLPHWTCLLSLLSWNPPVFQASEASTTLVYFLLSN